MPDHKLCVPCLFGLEGPLGNELRHMGLRDVMPENGRVRCTGTDADIARMNIRCRFGERVLLELGSFPAPTFDALFEGVKALPWADYLPADAAFPVKGYSLESALHSVPDCQKIIKKAVVESLKRRYRVGWFAETGVLYQIQFSLVHDTATLYLDTTGTPLHKRGYRPAHVAAPLRETLAAAAGAPPSTGELIASSGLDSSLVHRALGSLEKQGLVRRIGADFYFDVSALAAFEQAVRARLVDGPATAAELKDAMGTSRKYAIPLLEYFDSQAVTRREGDTRVPGGR